MNGANATSGDIVCNKRTGQTGVVVCGKADGRLYVAPRAGSPWRHCWERMHTTIIGKV